MALGSGDGLSVECKAGLLEVRERIAKVENGWPESAKAGWQSATLNEQGRVWIAPSSPACKHVVINVRGNVVAKGWINMLGRSPRVHAMWSPPFAHVYAAADAFAERNTTGFAGWVAYDMLALFNNTRFLLPPHTEFSICARLVGLPRQVAVSHRSIRSACSYWLGCFNAPRPRQESRTRRGEVFVRLNTGRMHVNHIFSTSSRLVPLAFRMAIWSAMVNVAVTVEHVPGQRNDVGGCFVTQRVCRHGIRHEPSRCVAGALDVATGRLGHALARIRLLEATGAQHDKCAVPTLRLKRAEGWPGVWVQVYPGCDADGVHYDVWAHVYSFHTPHHYHHRCVYLTLNMHGMLGWDTGHISYIYACACVLVHGSRTS